MGAVHLALMALDLASTGPPGTPLNRKSCSSSQLSIVARRNLNVSTGRSYMVLLPKKPGTTTVDAFRPICLQNCSIKIAAKSLTTKLQAEISSMIDLDQTAQGEIHFRKFCVRHGTGASVPQKESPNNCAETRFRQGFRHC